MNAGSRTKAEHDSISGKARGPARVLIVDDEPGVLLMFKTVLSGYGFVTEECTDAREAMALLEKRPFEVIVSDISMPGCDGLEFLRQVRARDLDVPVVLMTGKPSVESSRLAIEYGAFRYLIKPVMPSELKDVLDRAVRLREIAELKRAALELGSIDKRWLGDRAALEDRFERALAGIWIAFQPIVSFNQRKVYGYEALVRSQEPTLSNPGLLLEAAERLDRLPDLARVIRRLAASTPPPDAASLFVNLHARDLLDEDLYRSDSALAQLAERVVLELTERASMDAVPDLERRIERLRAVGFRIAIDDLGAGYAGLSSFALLDPDIAKLDMSLIRDIDRMPKKQSIVRSMSRLCEELGIEVVSEGVETEAERSMLTELGCDLFQGYFFARPGPNFPAPNWG